MSKRTLDKNKGENKDENTTKKKKNKIVQKLTPQLHYQLCSLSLAGILLIPKDIWIANILPYLLNCDIINLTITCKHLRNIFFNQCEKLRDNVTLIRKKYSEIENDIEKDIELNIEFEDNYNGFEGDNFKTDHQIQIYFQCMLHCIYTNDMSIFWRMFYYVYGDHRRAEIARRLPSLNYFCGLVVIMLKDREFVSSIVKNSPETEKIDNRLIVEEFSVYRPFNPDDSDDVKTFKKGYYFDKEYHEIDFSSNGNLASTDKFLTLTRLINRI